MMADKIHPGGDQSPSAPILEESRKEALIDVPLNSPRSHRGSSSDRKSVLPTYYQQDHRPPPPPRRKSCFSCCCFFSYLCGLLAFLILAVGAVVLVGWLVLRPIREPKYSVSDVALSQLNVVQTTTPPEVTSSISFRVRAENPNKRIGIYYDKVDVYAYYGSLEVGHATIPRFYQGTRNVTMISSNLNTTALPISMQLASELEQDIKDRDVPVRIVIHVRARVKVGALKSPTIKVRDICNIHVSPPDAPGGTRLLSKDCKLKIRL